MAALVQQPCIRNYNDVVWVSLNIIVLERENTYLVLRHFWHRVEAVALEGPPRASVPYRFIRLIDEGKYCDLRKACALICIAERSRRTL